MRTVTGAMLVAGLSAASAGAAIIENGVAGLKLIMLDKYGLGKAKAVYVAKGDPGIQKGPGIAAKDDPINLTGNVQIIQLGDPSNVASYDLPDPWLVNKTTVGKYVNKTAGPGGPGAKVVVVKPGLVGKLVAKNLGDGDSASGDDSATDFNLQAITDPNETIRVIVTVNNGVDGNTYVFCSDFTDLSIKLDNASQPFKVLSKSSTAPGSCAVGPTTTTTTSTSTTTTTLGCLCGSPSSLTFTAGIGAGSCGDVVDGSGTPLESLACSGFYVGGGGMPFFPPPFQLPDMVETVYAVTDCTGDVLSLAPTTSIDTGSDRNCTTTGCFFGPPLPVPIPATPTASACLKLTHTADATAGAVCSSGAVDMELTLNGEIRVAGDPQAMAAFGLCSGGPTPGARCFGGDCGVGGTCSGITDRCKGGANDNLPCTTRADCPDGFCTAGIQPCPVCYADSTSPTGSRCIAGTNNGNPCTPGSSELGDAYPTSQDCPSGAPVAGNLSVGFVLQNTPLSKTADAGGTFPACGFCRDANGTGKYGVCSGGPTPGAPCAETAECGAGGVCGGVVACSADGDCVEPREKCEQRDPGAFGLATAKTISETGVLAGDISDGLPHASTLVGVGCVPPTLNAAVDTGAGIPGPSAVALPGAVTLNP